ncbi:hypothetical protein [Pseudonocardia sp. 73-21]|uniref:hypothetical protein n=1 Tax=Pseudonocardia sp. 73-21 TaxID=1895809 RepID=UPI00095C8C0C|nr:hypothetical protein [Pseudonocardia sp. 73-21]OJY40311.1 MAG: hypothetical protein BGP03_00400 [Pseudonocardia sp. 73-21]
MIPCRTCTLPADDPDGQHPACAEHERERVAAVPCSRCGSWTSHRVLDTDPAVCSHCRTDDALREADTARAQLPPPPAVKPRPAPPVYRVGTGGDKIAEWVKS